MSADVAQDTHHARQIQEWMLALLRFAVSRDEADKAAFLSTARRLDAAGSSFAAPSFSFFLRTSADLCAAIATGAGPQSTLVLKRHLGRVQDLRLRRALEAALDLDPRPARKVADRRADLWRGLPGSQGSGS